MSAQDGPQHWEEVAPTFDDIEDEMTLHEAELILFGSDETLSPGA